MLNAINNILLDYTEFAKAFQSILRKRYAKILKRPSEFC
ncbi:hypothetical protein NEIFL0001_0484 [Neisseria flavescens SK114]|nr:hypothetical protein NEIFL0001_0484 [Neisseria flavescens SK114]